MLRISDCKEVFDAAFAKILPTSMSDDLKRAVVWKNLLLDGRDYCALWHTAEGWLLNGTVVGILEGRGPMLADYEIHCDDKWRTHRVRVGRTIGSNTKTLALNVESRGVWRGSVQELPDLRDCRDVDLAVTPATPKIWSASAAIARIIAARKRVRGERTSSSVCAAGFIVAIFAQS
jgi:hypothetical protein